MVVPVDGNGDIDIFVNAPSNVGNPTVHARGVFWVYLLLFAMSGFPNVAAQVGTTSTAQQLCPSEVLGRLGGLMAASGALGMGLGSVAAGLLLEIFTARVLFNGQVVVLALSGVISLIFIARPGAESERHVTVDPWPACMSGRTANPGVRLVAQPRRRRRSARLC